MIVPTDNLQGRCSGQCGAAEFVLRRFNNVITLQWETFAGRLISNGHRYLTVCQGICNLPNYELSFPISIVVCGQETFGRLIIDPERNYGNGHIHFVLPTGVLANDFFEIKGSSVNWIIC